MRDFIIRRLLYIIPMFLGVSLIVFALLTWQGNPFQQLLLNPRIKPEDVYRLMAKWHWDKPFFVRYFYWFREFIISTFAPAYGHGWGFSLLVPGKTAKELIMQKIPLTLTFSSLSIVFAFIIALPIGIYSAIRQYTIGDNLGTLFAFFGMSMPSFWFGLMLMLLFALKLKWLPAGGMHEAYLMINGVMVDFFEAPLIYQLMDRAKHLILPITVLTLLGIGGWMRYMRSSMLEVIRQDYVRTARAKGVPERRVILRHALRNGMIPIITLIGLSLPGLIGGAMITEQVYTLDGMGRLTVLAVFGNDIFVAMAILMIDSVLILLGSLIADILYAVVDPRIRYS